VDPDVSDGPTAVVPAPHARHREEGLLLYPPDGRRRSDTPPGSSTAPFLCRESPSAVVRGLSVGCRGPRPDRRPEFDLDPDGLVGDDRPRRAAVRLDVDDTILARELDDVVDPTDVEVEAVGNEETEMHPIVIPIGRRARDMATDESTITENYAATIPASVRDRLDVQPGDKLRWTATEEGELRVEIVRQREGALDDFEPEPMGGDGKTAHDLLGAER